MTNYAGFDQSGLEMNADLGDPRRQSKLPGGYATQGQAALHILISQRITRSVIGSSTLL